MADVDVSMCPTSLLRSGEFAALAPCLYKLSGHHHAGKDASRSVDHQGPALLEIVVGQVHDSVPLLLRSPTKS